MNRFFCGAVTVVMLAVNVVPAFAEDRRPTIGFFTVIASPLIIVAGQAKLVAEIATLVVTFDRKKAERAGNVVAGWVGKPVELGLHADTAIADGMRGMSHPSTAEGASPGQQAPPES